MEPSKLLNEWLLELGAEGRDFLQRVSAEQRDLTVEVLTDIARLRVRELSGVDVSGELALAESSLRDLRAAVAVEWAKSVNRVLENSSRMIGSAIKGILAALG